jgi:hypothetical protein
MGWEETCVVEARMRFVPAAGRRGLAPAKL